MSNTQAHPDEEVLWTGSISQFHYAGRWLLIVLLLLGLAATFVIPPLEDLSKPWLVRGIIAGVALLIYLAIRVDRARRRYTVTNKRIIIEFGFVDKQSNEIRLQDVRSINLVRSGFAGIFGIGRVEFSSAARDDADVIFWNTPDAEKVRDLVRSLQAKI
jgi:uncharacterized membrane protein YdbT with pleckstrin-like domain